MCSFEKRRMGFFDLMEGYRKSDALVRYSLNFVLPPAFVCRDKNCVYIC